VHQAKGLEYRVVFVVMLCEALFPSARSVEDPQTLEEERRLFYVAVTRAEDELYLCYPLLRFTQAQGMMMLERSRFIDEVPRELLEEWNLRPARSMDFGGAWPREAPPHGEIRAGEEDPF
jgi:DNA helicase-2/ATP-dependent DNA helicase PcrA